jgi:hypothetical protein
MKKIETKSDVRKRSRRNQWIIGVILVFVMIGSTFGIIMDSFGSTNSNSKKIIYHNHQFVLQNNFWVLTEGKYSLSFSYNPLEVENLSNSLKGNLSYLNSYLSLPLYISSNDYSSNSEIYNVLSPFVERVQTACYKDENCSLDIPTKDCANNFIIIRESETNLIYQEDKCVFIKGKKQDLVKLIDIYLYKILGV